jgi:hypothetical protein
VGMVKLDGQDEAIWRDEFARGLVLAFGSG